MGDMARSFQALTRALQNTRAATACPLPPRSVQYSPASARERGREEERGKRGRGEEEEEEKEEENEK